MAKRFPIELDDEFHSKLKKIAQAEGRTMKGLINKFIREGVDKKEGETK